MSNEDLNPDNLTSSTTSSRAQKFNDQILSLTNSNHTLTRTSSSNSIPSITLHSKDTSIESNSPISTTTSGKFIDTHQTTPTSKSKQIVSNGLPVRVPLGERRRTYEDDIGRSTAIEVGGANSDSEGSERRSSGGKVIKSNENPGGIKKRASSVELRNNYTSEENNYEGSLSFRSNT